MPILAGAGIAAGGSIISSLIGSSAATKAAQQQAAAQQQVFNNTAGAVQGGQANVGNNVGIANSGLSSANSTASGYLNDASSLFSPYATAGTSALGSLQSLAGAGGPLDKTFSFNPSDLSSDPGYQFTLQQGQQAIQRAAAAQGGLFSSGTLKSLAGYTTGTADQYFNDAFNRAQSTFNTNTNTALQRIGSLQNLANYGYNATGAQAGLAGQQAHYALTVGGLQANYCMAGAEFGSNLGLQGSQIEGNALSNQGNANAAGTVGSANAITTGIGGATNSINQFLQLRNLQSIFGGNGTGGGSSSSGYQVTGPPALTPNPPSESGNAGLF